MVRSEFIIRTTGHPLFLLKMEDESGIAELLVEQVLVLVQQVEPGEVNEHPAPPL